MGAGAAWLLGGMDATARLMTVVCAVLDDDPRIAFVTESADAFLERQPTAFADTAPGKFSHLDQAVRRLRPAVRRPLRARLAPSGRPGGD